MPNDPGFLGYVLERLIDNVLPIAILLGISGLALILRGLNKQFGWVNKLLGWIWGVFLK